MFDAGKPGEVVSFSANPPDWPLPKSQSVVNLFIVSSSVLFRNQNASHRIISFHNNSNDAFFTGQSVNYGFMCNIYYLESMVIYC